MVYVLGTPLLAGLIWFGNPALALLCGATWTLIQNAPPLPNSSKLGKLCLQTAIVLLGLRLNMAEITSISANNLWYVAGFVLGVLLLGTLLGRLLRVEQVTTTLIASGTAICGGTAIASISPLLGARSEQTGIAITVVFILNAVALLTFPTLGHWLGLSQDEFGLFAALAIHDTSSVVATAAIYGDQALSYATTTKLGRTLWLIPLVLFLSVRVGAAESGVRFPGFIGLFLLAALLASFVQIPGELLFYSNWLSKSLLVVALFFVGSEISRAALAKIRVADVVFGVALWGVAIAAALAIVRYA